jgi:hypothetical protein
MGQQPSFLYLLPAGFLPDLFFDLKMEAKYFSETSVDFYHQTTWCYDPVVMWPEFLAKYTEVPGSISFATGFSEKLWVWNWV